MGSLNDVIDAVYQFLLTAYHDVNNLRGLLIALFAVVLMGSWRQLIPIAFGASIVRMLVDVIIPIGERGINVDDIKLPDFMQLSFWNAAATLYVGFLILIAMFFAVKKVVFMRGGKRAKAH